ncbi:MAG: trimeric intracellular cation channel family protein [Undibacterium sp.]|uniref:trimeric intracellular cation channel family protein n=1 Tax=Undibacterium sp. TaxID=1914977 RepID=UPI0027234024|nr:trimeric intracellular cation channel family protein [Undibacterium sp.]MDO8650910.1 trimeric intracellular cation channel family protein [Undibacterium sp.]
MTTLHLGMSTVLHIVEVTGIIAFASSGVIEARQKEMDMVGVFTVAFITAFGGGTLRDLLLDRRPLFWVEHQEYPILIFLMALISIPFLRHLRHAVAEKAIIYADALGLGLFSVTGASLAAEAQMPLFVCVMMGVITGIFGGVLRDVICNEIPLVFRRGQLYATCSFVGCWLYLLIEKAGVTQSVSLLMGISVTFLLRALAVRFHWTLPG